MRRRKRTFNGRRVHAAKRSYHCDNCDRIIGTGEFHWYYVGVTEGAFGHMRVCSRCEPLVEVIDYQRHLTGRRG